MKRWLLMNIGCLECGNASEVRGAFDTAEEALTAGGTDARLASDMREGPYGDWEGESVLVVFELENSL